jgi:DNA-binding response OmpR family regulator
MASPALPAPDAGPAIQVLLVEDDARLARLTADYLAGHGLNVQVVGDGKAAVEEALRVRYDVVLLDIMLPGMDGLEVCRAVRARSDVPIIMVTARGDEVDRVLGLELGSDDYLTKPYSSRELLARIRAFVRRRRGQSGPHSQALRVGELELDSSAMRARLGGKELALTSYEFALLRALAEHRGRVMSREQLMELARGSAEEAFDRSVDVHICHLRFKLGDDSRRPRLLKTVRGSGYLLADDT